MDCGNEPPGNNGDSARQGTLIAEKGPLAVNPSGESLDEQIDLLISAFSALKRLPVLEKEIEAIKRENEKARYEIERLKSQERKRLEQENRWMLIRDDDRPGAQP